MTLKRALALKVGQQVYNKHYRRTESFVRLIERPADCTDERIKYPLLITKESGEDKPTSYRLFT